MADHWQYLSVHAPVLSSAFDELSVDVCQARMMEPSAQAGSHTQVETTSGATY